MFERLSRFMSMQTGKPRSAAFRLWALLSGSFFFLVLVPLLLGFVARFLVRPLTVPVPRPFEIASGVSMICLGLSILIWAVSAFWRFGDGTPAPVAAPQKLVVRGPYRYCRNPIQLGATCYFFGLGCVAVSFVAGLAMFFMGLVIGSVYHKFVEEPDLLFRFGQDYDDYRKRTPFLIPRPWRKYSH